MSRYQSSPLAAGELTPVDLHRIARSLIDIHLAGPHLVQIRVDASGRKVGLLPLAELHPPAVHPLVALVGFTAPPTWQALGVVASGTAQVLRGGSRPERSTRVRSALLVARNGAQGAALEPTEVALEAVNESPVEGLLGDALRRCLKLGTPSPAHPPSTWLTGVWLDRLCATLENGASGATSSVSSISDALARHPLADPQRRPPDVATLRASLARVDAAGWEALRTAASLHGTAALLPHGVAALISPDLARWADSGSLARLLAAELPPGPFLLDAVRALLPPAVQRAVLPLAAETFGPATTYHS